MGSTDSGRALSTFAAFGAAFAFAAVNQDKLQQEGGFICLIGAAVLGVLTAGMTSNFTT